MPSRVFANDKQYLHIPARDDDYSTFRFIRVYDGDEMVHEFHIGISDTAKGERTDFYVALYLGNYKSDTVRLETDSTDSDTVFDGIVPGGRMEEEPSLYPDLYHEKERQQIHFSPRRGWLNDPNGLFYKDGKYNMYFQHNPFGPHHGCTNVSWGHAVSEDGLHFTEYPDAIQPYSTRCHVASGSAIVDETDISGLGKDTIIAAYTALQSKQWEGRPEPVNEGQYLLYSKDGGMTFEYFPGGPIITVPAGEEWRDPKILRTDDGTFCIAVYETEDGKDVVSFYTSTDCRNWTLRSRGKDLYECPDLFRATVAETGEQLWVLYGANGKYKVGEFEDFRFTEKEDPGMDLYLDYGSAVYAGQTFNNHPDSSCRYHFAWMQDMMRRWWFDEACPDRGTGWSQSMSLLCTLTLHKTDLGYRLFRAPIEGVKTLRKGEAKDVKLRDGMKLDSPCEYIFRMDKDKPFRLLFADQGIKYDPETRTIHSRFTENAMPSWFTFDDEKRDSYRSYKIPGDGDLEFRMFADTRSVELFLNGEISITFSSLTAQDRVTLEGPDELDAKVYSLESIWR